MSNIVYLHGNLLNLFPRWAESIATATQHQPHLLPQMTESLQAAGHENRLVVAVDKNTDAFVGSIALWPLGVTTRGIQWFELGTVFVTEVYRFPQSGLGVADELHRQIIELANGHNLMATTTNPSERKAWHRTGLIPVSFQKMPQEVLPATCVCPAYKIGVTDPLTCPQRDRACTAALSLETWQRLNST